MTQLALSWLAFPAVLWILSLGLGRSLVALAGVRLPLHVLVPSGFATLIVVSTATTATPIAHLTTPLVTAIAAVGLAYQRPRRPTRVEVYGLLAAGCVFLAYGAPVLSSGTATFTGFIKLDDTATFLAFVDQLFTNGRDLSELAPSSYEAALAVNVGNGYPVGTFTPLGVGAQLVATDPAWVWQPAIAVSGALLCLALFALSRASGLGPVAAAAVSTVAAQAALLYGYGLWGGAKEVLGAAILALCVAVTFLTRPMTPRSALVPAAAAAAFLAVMSLGGVVWLLPAAALFVVGVHSIRTCLALVGFAGAFSLPTLIEAGAFLRQDNVTSFRNDAELGNLFGPLPVSQIIGAWPTGDFRASPDATVTSVLLVVVVAGIVVAIASGWNTRRVALAALALSVVLPCVVFVGFGSPWLGGKSLAMSAPAVLALGLSGLLALRGSWRLVGFAAAGVVSGAVVWSNVLQYREAWIAPYDQLRELEAIGDRFAGQGPALMTEYSPNAVRHFLRDLEAEGASELRRRLVPLADGSTLDKAEFVDVDELDLDNLTATYALLVLRRSPVGSRPPGAYRLALRGQWYDVWQRSGPALPHLALGSPLAPNGVPACSELSVFAAGAQTLEFPVPVPSVVVGLTAPQGWSQVNSSVVTPPANGELTLQVTVPSTGAYGVWIGGSFRGTLTATVNASTTMSASNHLNPSGTWLRLGVVDLETGTHLVTLRITDGWRSGSSGPGFPLGPLALAQESHDTVATSAASSPTLCSTALDWLERREGG